MPEAATEPMLMMLPPLGLKCCSAACVVSRRPSTLRLNCLLKLLRRDGFNGAELVDAGVVDEHVDGAKLLWRRWPTSGPMDSGSARLACTAMALPPAALISATTLSAPALLPE